MQKVESSSLFSRSQEKPRSGGVFLCPEAIATTGFWSALPPGATTHRPQRSNRLCQRTARIRRGAKSRTADPRGTTQPGTRAELQRTRTRNARAHSRRGALRHGAPVKSRPLMDATDRRTSGDLDVGGLLPAGDGEPSCPGPDGRAPKATRCCDPFVRVGERNHREDLGRGRVPADGPADDLTGAGHRRVIPRRRVGRSGQVQPTDGAHRAHFGRKPPIRVHRCSAGVQFCTRIGGSAGGRWG